MKVAYILSATVPNGGATKAFANLLEELEARDVHPFVVVPDGGGIAQDLAKRNVPLLVCTYRPSSYPHARTLKEKLLFLPRLLVRLLVNAKASRQVEAFLQRHEIELVHTNSGTIRIGFDAAQRVGLPHVYHIREYGALDFGIRYFPTKKVFLRQLEAKESYSICITKDVQRYFHQQKNSSSKVIYDGVFPAMPTMPSAERRNYFLYAGRIQPAKGLDQLLKAYELYVQRAEQPLLLKVAGSRTNSPYCQEQFDFVAAHHLEDRVEFLGECDDIAGTMRQARALIIPSPNEGFGFCMPEAMQQGCLCIGRNTGGTKEQLDNAVELTGKEIGLRYETVEELAELLCKVGSGQVSGEDACRQRAFSVVNQLYSRHVHAKKVYEFYEEILSKKRC